jgi:hypothetical protein
MLEEISPGVVMVPSPPTYEGHWFRRADGFIFGIRRSKNHGITFETIESAHPIVGDSFKVHQK